MNRIEELIKEKCPDGVEYIRLEELCSGITKQTGFDYSSTIKPALVKEASQDTYAFIQNKDFDGDKINLNTDYYIPINVAEKYPKIILDIPSLLISLSGKVGNVGFYGLDSKAFIGGAVGICKLKDGIVGKFVMHYLMSAEGQKYLFKSVKAASHVNLTVESIRDTPIPVPPIEVQQEIVRILDKFTDLEAELQAELDARKKQYIAVSDSFFDNEVERINITEIADTYIGLVTTMTKHYVPEGVPLIHNSNIKENRFQFSEMTYLDQAFANKNESRKHQLKDIVTVHTGDVGTSAIIEDELVGSLGFATIVTRVKDKSQFLPEYVCYYLNSADNKRNITRMIKSDRSNLNLKDFNRLMIPVYDVDIQKRIVQILSKFHEISVDAISGLPAEIAARHKQYEYYRDKLLTFERKVV